MMMSDNRVVGQLDFSGKRHIGVMLILLSAFLYSPVGVFSKGVDADSWSIIFWRGAIAVPAGIFYLMLTGKLGNEWCRLWQQRWRSCWWHRSCPARSRYRWMKF